MPNTETGAQSFRSEITLTSKELAQIIQDHLTSKFAGKKIEITGEVKFNVGTLMTGYGASERDDPYFESATVPVTIEV
jgi:hypothetical protein